MGILDRVGTLIRANLNDLLDRAEDPEKVLKQLLLDMNSELVKVKTQVAAAIADEKLLYKRYEENQKLASEWQGKAELAVRKSDDDLAKQALARRNAYQQTADGFKTQWQEQSQQVEVLKDALRKLEQKIQEAEARKDLLIARHRRAQAETKIRETLAGVDTSSALSHFEAMEDRVEESEARAKAAAELETDSLEERFQALESESTLDSDLAALKAQLSPGGDNPAQQ
jgi:phage shock protein A